MDNNREIRLNGQVLVIALPVDCANLDCANKLGQGQFTITTLGNVRLFLCSPCSKRITDIAR